MTIVLLFFLFLSSLYSAELQLLVKAQEILLHKVRRGRIILLLYEDEMVGEQKDLMAVARQLYSKLVSP